ncbi:MAG: Hypothetical protein AJITA_00924 [Acetilactobacillus jinshanensis]
MKNLSSLKRYFKLFGLAPNASAALAYMNQGGLIYHRPKMKPIVITAGIHSKRSIIPSPLPSKTTMMI